ncbi:MAG: TonB-dependent receptor, partial [Bacteroidetes bacterium]|nr:TonB-dependent receptor [Bacteroidota bacterium]
MRRLLKVFMLLLLFIAGTAGAYAQRTVTGTVVDENKVPVAGANVVVKGTQVGAITDALGKYSIAVPSAGNTLVISFIGYTSQEVPIGTSSVINVTLQTESLALDEIVVVGYSTQRRADVTGAISSVSSERITALPAGNLDQTLQGRAAGLVVISNGAPGFGATIRVRGISTVNDANPLFVVDGVVATTINNLNPSDIERIEVLKDASTAAIYGSLGSNGVIMVTTKKGKAGKVTVDFEG